MSMKQDIIKIIGIKLNGRGATQEQLVAFMQQKLSRLTVERLRAEWKDICSHSDLELNDYVKANVICTASTYGRQTATERYAASCRRNIREGLFRIALRIRTASDNVEVPDCEELHQLMWDSTTPPVLREQLGIIWKSSRCSNGDLVRMSLELVANTIKN